jgi:hypothetical protein
MPLRNLRLITPFLCSDCLHRATTAYIFGDAGFPHCLGTQPARDASRSAFCTNDLERYSDKNSLFHEDMLTYLNQCIKHHQILLEWVIWNSSRNMTLATKYEYVMMLMTVFWSNVILYWDPCCRGGWDRPFPNLTFQRLNFFTSLCTNPGRTSQETFYVSATKPNRLMLFGKQSLFIVRTIRNTQIHCVGRM